MENNINNDEIIIDFRKIWLTILYRKSSIFACFAIIIALALIATMFMPKKYESEAKILINKTNATNLAELNPFMISGMSDMAGGMAGLLNGGSNLVNEMEIMKSPLVLDPVIRINQLKYKKGPKKGEYISADDFLKKEISIDSLKGTNVITIKFESENPELAYNVVDSIIKNYKEIYEEINVKKAGNDKEFLKKSYTEAKQLVDQKIQKLKSSSISANSGGALGTFSILQFYDKRINKDLSSISSSDIDAKKTQMELDQEVEKLKMVKSKYDWSSLVENLSKDATNIIILKNPELSKSFDNTEPKIIINIILAIVFSFFVSIIVILLKEKNDVMLSYTTFNEDAQVVNEESQNFSNLLVDLFISKPKEISIVSLVDKSIESNLIRILKSNFPDIKIFLTSQQGTLKNHIDNISNAENLILLSKIGFTDKNCYKQLKYMQMKLNKSTIADYIFKN